LGSASRTKHVASFHCFLEDSNRTSCRTWHHFCATCSRPTFVSTPFNASRTDR
jgi:hypothetical protein